MSNGFQRVPSHIRSIAGTEVEKGRLFERLMKAYFRQDPLYGDRFSDVWLRHPPRTSVRTAPVTIAVETTVELQAHESHLGGELRPRVDP